jgi:hypothetical protein
VCGAFGDLREILGVDDNPFAANLTLHNRRTPPNGIQRGFYQRQEILFAKLNSSRGTVSSFEFHRAKQ